MKTRMKTRTKPRMKPRMKPGTRLLATLLGLSLLAALPVFMVGKLWLGL